MKKKAITLVSSCAAIAVCTGLIVGSTYALFSSNDVTDITVSAGKVAITSQVGELTAYSMGVKQENGVWENNGRAYVEDGNVILSNITPGDSVEIPVSIANGSSVSALYNMQVVLNEEDKLAEGLEVSISGSAGEYAGIIEYVSNWMECPAEGASVTVTVSLPTGAGNEYMLNENGEALSTKVKLTVGAIQANGAEEGTGMQLKCKVSSENALKAAIEAGGDIIVTDNFSVSEVINITKDTKINLNGKTITNNAVGPRPFQLTKEGVSLSIDGTAEGSGILTAGKAYGLIDICANNVSVTVNGGNFGGNTDDGSLFRVNKALCEENWHLTLNNVECATNSTVVRGDVNGYLTVIGGKYVVENDSNCAVFNVDCFDSTFKNVIIESKYIQCVDVVGKVTFENCKFGEPQPGKYPAWRSTAFSASFGSEATINGGEYKGYNAAYVFNSGGTININGGTFVGTNAAIKGDYSADRPTTVNVFGGDFDGAIQMDDRGTLNICGGTFKNVKITEEKFLSYVAEGYKAVKSTDENGVTVYTVVENA